MFPHHFKSDSGDGWLEIGLLCVDHYADVQLLGKLHTKNKISLRTDGKKIYYVAESVDAANHVLEHLFLLGSQLRDETYHAAGFKIR